MCFYLGIEVLATLLTALLHFSGDQILSPKAWSLAGLSLAIVDMLSRVVSIVAESHQHCR